MFKIALNLGPIFATGLTALDIRRSLGLSDGTSISTATLSTRGCRQPHCEVSETMARTWFCKNDISHAVTVPIEFIQPGDVVMLDNGYSVTFADLSEQRIIDLFVAAKLRELQAELAKTKRALEDMEDALGGKGK